MKLAERFTAVALKCRQERIIIIIIIVWFFSYGDVVCTQSQFLPQLPKLYVAVQKFILHLLQAAQLASFLPLDLLVRHLPELHRGVGMEEVHIEPDARQYRRRGRSEMLTQFLKKTYHCRHIPV